MGLNDLKDKCEAFGWQTVETDGHSFEDLTKNITFKKHWYFDLEKNVWIESLDLPYGLHGMGSGICNNALYIFGGANSAGMNSFHTLQDKTFKLECK